MLEQNGFSLDIEDKVKAFVIEELKKQKQVKKQDISYKASELFDCKLTEKDKVDNNNLLQFLNSHLGNIDADIDKASNSLLKKVSVALSNNFDIDKTTKSTVNSLKKLNVNFRNIVE